jgi:hypothetical protein
MHMTRTEAEMTYEDIRELLKKLLDGSRLGASEEYMDLWLQELDQKMMYCLVEAVRAGELPEDVRQRLTAH